VAGIERPARQTHARSLTSGAEYLNGYRDIVGFGWLILTPA
jgi:hypothetical protein